MKGGSRRRHLLKTLTWRVIATGTTFLLAWFYTDDLTIATAIGGTEAVAKMVLYYLHERAWYQFVSFDAERQVTNAKNN